MKVQLYIGDYKVDLNDSNLILLNYQFEDFNSPTDIKNSYSQDVEIEGTINNDLIFGNCFNLDSDLKAGTFNPLEREPFVIYNEMGEKLEEGYVKLNEVKREGGKHSYSVTLFGSLGAIFYGLTYNEDGSKKQLADLDYLTGGENELNFQISSANIKKAWTRVNKKPTEVQELFDVINFAPCYNGIPETNFEANKGIFKPSDLGLPETIDGYTLKEGKSLLTLPSKITEQQAGEMRSWQQRPVVSMASIFKGVAKELQKKGITFDYSNVSRADNPYWRAWVTLPLLEKATKTEGTYLEYFYRGTDSYVTANPVMDRIAEPPLPDNTKIKGNINIQLFAKIDNASRFCFMKDNAGNFSVTFIQALFYNNGVQVAGTNTGVVGATNGIDLSTLANALGHKPLVENGYVRGGDDEAFWENLQDNEYSMSSSVNLTLGETNQVGQQMKLMASSYRYSVTADGRIVKRLSSTLPVMFSEQGAELESVAMSQYNDQNFFYLEKGTFSQATITKKMLLSTKNTPADYIISFAKMFGYYFIFDNAESTLRLLDRNTLFTGEVLDIEAMIDNEESDFTPNNIKAKYYDYKSKGGEGAFDKWYRENYGNDYGERLVNTGYDFDSSSKNVMDKVIFKNAVTSIEQSQDFARYEGLTGGTFFPAPVVRGGAKYTLWNNRGEAKEFPIPVPKTSAIWFDADNNGYDYPMSYKLQLHDKSERGIDGSDILVLFAGGIVEKYNRLTDDNVQMQVINNGVRCWNFENNKTSIFVPVFTRSFRWDRTNNSSLDFGVPAELNVPPEGGQSLVYERSYTIYDKRWRAYMEDRYSVNSKVLRLKVNFEGMQVTNELLRKFYWFDNAIWQLNRIINHSLTTNDLTECEFVKVQNIESYTKGQK